MIFAAFLEWFFSSRNDLKVIDNGMVR